MPRLIKTLIAASCLPLMLIACWLTAYGQQKDSGHPYGSSRAIQEPQLFIDGIISTGFDEIGGSFTPDGRTIYFTKGIQWNEVSAIVYSRFERGRWQTPEVARFSGRYLDQTPCVSPDGAKIFFSSNRPAQAGKAKSDFDIWMVEKTATGWNEPKRLSAEINSDADEQSPFVARDGTLYFASNRAGGKGGFDIYRARRENGNYSKPENLGEAINSTAGDSDACIDGDGRFIIFASNRAGGAGGWDLYISYNRNGEWTATENLGPKVNSRTRERYPMISPDNRYLFFTSIRGMADSRYQPERMNYETLLKKIRSAGNDSADIYQIEIAALPHR